MDFSSKTNDLMEIWRKNNFAFKVTGIFEQNKETQLRNFITELDFRTKKKHEQPKDWYEAFGYLRDYIEELPKDTKQVLFFDEMPWMDTQKSDFLPSFEWFWNHYASTIDNIVFIYFIRHILRFPTRQVENCCYLGEIFGKNILLQKRLQKI